MSKIDITNQDIRCMDELCFTDDAIEASYELWFDVDAYFGTDTREKDRTWINFYTYWHPDTKTVTAVYFVESDEDCKECQHELSDKEKAFFLAKMEEHSKIVYGMPLEKLWNTYGPDSE
jgi:hypothetical protein